ncbi:hypothetical protein AB571B5_01198 [Acinetobacter baumannii]|nr:hypothetical protein AB571B5_01198 [Acinetobacter baumannii]
MLDQNIKTQLKAVLYLPFKFIQLGCRLFFLGQKF